MPEQQQQSGHDSSLDFLWLIALVIGAIILLWYFDKAYIASVVFHVRFYEMAAVDFFLGLIIKFTNLTGLPTPQFDFNELIDVVRKGFGAEVSFNDLVRISTIVGNYLRYPLMLLVFGGAAWLHFGGASQRFRHVFSTSLLKNMEKEIWPQIAPVVGLELVKTKLDEGSWAFSLSPMRFCKKNDLLDIKKQRNKYSATLKSGVAYRLLSLQVGPRWGGVEALPIHLKALFAAFVARINADKSGAETLLDQISASASGKELNFKGTEELLRKYVGSKKVGKILSRHAYVTTVFASMLVGARELGVLASAEFIWLKPIDRRMWYMLNTVGRPTAVPEICGAFAHWLAEKKLGLPLAVPMVDEAVKGLEIALSEVIYKPDEE